MSHSLLSLVNSLSAPINAYTEQKYDSDDYDWYESEPYEYGYDSYSSYETDSDSDLDDDSKDSVYEQPLPILIQSSVNGKLLSIPEETKEQQDESVSSIIQTPVEKKEEIEQMQIVPQNVPHIVPITKCHIYGDCCTHHRFRDINDYVNSCIEECVYTTFTNSNGHVHHYVNGIEFNHIYIYPHKVDNNEITYKQDNSPPPYTDFERQIISNIKLAHNDFRTSTSTSTSRDVVWQPPSMPNAIFHKTPSHLLSHVLSRVTKQLNYKYPHILKNLPGQKFDAMCYQLFDTCIPNIKTYPTKNQTEMKNKAMQRCIVLTISKILQTKWFVSDEKTNYNKKYKKQIMLTIIATLCIQEMSNYDCRQLIINTSTNNTSSTDTTDEDELDSADECDGDDDIDEYAYATSNKHFVMKPKKRHQLRSKFHIKANKVLVF